MSVLVDMKLLPLWYESHLVNALKEDVVPLVPARVGNADVLNISLLFVVPTVKAEGVLLANFAFIIFITMNFL